MRDNLNGKLVFIIFVLTFLLIFQILQKNTENENLRFTNVYNSNVPIEKNNSKNDSTKELKSRWPRSDKIGEIDRFEWYRKHGLSKKPENNKHPIPKKIFLYFAYEFEHEYSIIYTNRFILGMDLYCRYFSENSTEIHEPVKSISFPEYVVNCPKRPGTKRVALSVTKDGIYDLTIPLIDRMPKAEKYEFSLCLSPIYGHESKWLLLAETVEHYKLQGVQHFYVYAHKLDGYDLRILEDYVRTGEMEVHFMLELETREDKEWQMIMYRDCLIRSRGESRWSIFADTDERLIMTGFSGTLLEYLRTFNDSRISGFQFRPRWILKDQFMPLNYTNDDQIEEWMPTRRWHNTSSVAPFGHTTKCIVDPMKVLSMWVHYPELHYPGYELISLRPEEGIVRHYRDINHGDWGNIWFKEVLTFGPMEMTKYPEKYLKKLTENVKMRVKYVYSNYENDLKTS